jgi:hypothetical protein
MFRATGRCLTVAALCLALGWHWAALQGVAWTVMLVRNASSYSLAEAVTKTFDGGHPCSLCHAVGDGLARSSNEMTRSAGNSKPQPIKVSTSTKPDLLCSVHLLRMTRESRNLSYEVRDVVVVKRREAPPLPPPRPVLS